MSDAGEQAPAVFSTMVACCNLGLPRLVVPEQMKRDLIEYRTDQDVLGEFLDGKLEKNELGFVSMKTIYEAYTGWCFNNGIRNVMTSPDLAKTLKERGYTPHRKTSARGFRVSIIGTEVPLLETVMQ